MLKQLITICILLQSTSILAQSDSVNNKKFNYYLGLHANQLIKEFINFGSASINNPYQPLIVFQMHNAKGFGLRTGIDYYLNNNSTFDAANTRNTKQGIGRVKLGLEKYQAIGYRFKASFGIDLISRFGYDNTDNKFVSFDTVITVKKDKIFEVGIGPGVRLTYNVTNRILIGTEAGYYFTNTRNTTKNSTTIKNQFGTDVVNEIDGKDIRNNTILQLPSSLFLIVQLNKPKK